MRIVYATTGLPQHRQNGGEIASMNVVEALEALGHKVEVVGYARLGTEAPVGPNIHSAGPWPIEMAEAGARRYLWVARALATGRPIINAKFISRAYLRALDRARPQTADLLLVDHAHMGWVADLPGLPARRVFVAHNVETELYGAVGTRAGGVMGLLYEREGRRLAGLERRLVQSSAQTWVLSEGDQAGLVALAGEPERFRVFDLPGQDLLAAGAGGEAGAAPLYDIGMIGSWSWEINRRGVLWFVNEVLPLLPEGLTVAIAGAGSQTLPGDDPRLSRLGRVDDAGAFMRQCAVLAVPTLVGSGVQLKTIEGIAIGRPLVATPLAMRGIAAAPDHVRVAETAQAFASALIEARRAAPPAHEVGQNWARERRARFEAEIEAAIAGIMLQEDEANA